jgi:hypothetical protein
VSSRRRPGGSSAEEDKLVKKFVTVVCACALLGNLSGCGGGSADSLTKDFIDQMNGLADAIEKKDEAKAKEMMKKVDETAKKLKDVKVTESEKKKLEEKYTKDLTSAGEKVGKAMGKEPEFCKKCEIKLPTP